MSEFYTPTQRKLQDEFKTRGLANRLVQAIVTEELSIEQTAFIHHRDMFFLSPIDEQGFPCSGFRACIEYALAGVPKLRRKWHVHVPWQR